MPMSSDPMGTPAYTAPAGPSQSRMMQQQLLNQVKGDMFTYLLGAGVIVLGFFLFLSLLDVAKVGRKQAKVDEGKLAQDKEDQLLQRRSTQASQGKAGVTMPTEDERKARKTARDAWEETAFDLQNEVSEARIASKAWRYWYTWGAFLGSAMVTIASLAYVAMGQTTTRRVTGAVVLVFMLVTFLGALIGKAPAIAISP